MGISGRICDISVFFPLYSLTKLRITNVVATANTQNKIINIFMYSRIESLNLISAISVSPIYSLCGKHYKNAAVSSGVILPHRLLLCKKKKTLAFNEGFCFDSL